MKKKLALLYTALFIVVSLWAQKTDKGGNSNEFRYFSISVGTVNNFLINAKENDYTLLATPSGDMKGTPVFLSYSPGIDFNLRFNFDSQDNTSGFVVGLGVQNYGFSVVSKAETTEGIAYKLTDMYNATAVVVPFYWKTNSDNLYVDQTYFIFGGKLYYNFLFYNNQFPSWEGNYSISKLPSGAQSNFSFSFMAGANVNIYYVTIEMLTKNFVNTRYSVQTFEGVVSPYSSFNWKTRFYINAGVHIPLTRWTTSRSWTAEKIRRMLKF